MAKNPTPAPARSGAPYQYPTPAMVDAYRNGINGMPGTATPLDTSSMAAPAIGGPMTTNGAAPSRSIRQRLAILILGADAGNILFPPQQPLQPIAQPLTFGAVGRQFDYQVGFNTKVPPRSGQPVTFAQLDALANGYDVLRIMLERVKDKVISQTWSVGPKDNKAKRDARSDLIEDFLAYPDKVHTWDDWLRMLMEQVLVYDAPAIWLRPTKGGDLYSLEILDGSLISPKIMADGRLPPPDYGPAYQQVLKGLPAIDYVQPVPKGQPVPLDPTGQPFPELFYRPRNIRVNSVYGYSPVEQIIRTVQIGIAGEQYMLDYYERGSTPDLLLSTPETWNAGQIAQFQDWWDAVLLGNMGNRRGTRFIPHGVEAIDTKEKALLNAEVQEWLVRVMCFALGLNPMPFVKMMNKGQEETHHAEAAEEGLKPWLEWVANFINTLILIKFGWRDVVFRWQEESPVDPKTQAEIHKIYLDTKVKHPDEIRAEMGDEAMPDDMRSQMDMATFASTANASVLPPDQQADADKRAEVQADREAVRLKAAGVENEKSKAAEKVELAALLKAFDRPAVPPTINVAAPTITMPPINFPAVKIDAPTINVQAAQPPDVVMGDVFVDIGPTNVRVEPQAGKPATMGKTVTAERTADGKFVGTITDGVARKVEATLDADGNVIAKKVD